MDKSLDELKRNEDALDNMIDSKAKAQVVNDYTDWQRLSPISILYFMVKSFYAMANTLFYLLPALALNFSKIIENPLILVFAAGGFLLLFSVIGFLNYFFYRFRLEIGRVEIKQGVFKKSHIDLPFERIQNVKLEQPLYYRFNNYACVELDTAGSAKQEAKIVALKMQQAEALRQVVVANSKQQASTSGQNDGHDSATDESQEVILNRRSMKDLVIHGISNNRVWIFLGALAPFYNSLADMLQEIFAAIGFDAEAYFSIETQAWWEFGLHILSVAMLLMLIVVILSVIGSILMFYKYTLSKIDNRYIRRSGLLTKQEVSMKLRRIQIMYQAQDWLDVLLKRVNLYFEQNKTGTANANKPGQQMSNTLLVPSVTLDESRALMLDAMPSQRLSEQAFAPISKRLILKNTMLFALPLGAITFGLIAKNGLAGIAISVGLIAIFFAIVSLRWWRWGYSFDDEFIYIRKGFLGVNYYCFPIHKIQQAQCKQNVFIKPYKLASLRIILASGAQTIPYMPEDVVRHQINRALDNLVTDKRSWM